MVLGRSAEVTTRSLLVGSVAKPLQSHREFEENVALCHFSFGKENSDAFFGSINRGDMLGVFDTSSF